MLFSNIRGKSGDRGPKPPMSILRLRSGIGGAGGDCLDRNRGVRRELLRFFRCRRAYPDPRKGIRQTPSNSWFRASSLPRTLAAYLRNDKIRDLPQQVCLQEEFSISSEIISLCSHCDMGAFGAGLATAIGSVISIIVMGSHFLTKKNSLRLVRPTSPLSKFREISVTGFFHLFY